MIKDVAKLKGFVVFGFQMSPPVAEMRDPDRPAGVGAVAERFVALRSVSVPTTPLVVTNLEGGPIHPGAGGLIAAADNPTHEALRAMTARQLHERA